MRNLPTYGDSSSCSVFVNDKSEEVPWLRREGVPWLRKEEERVRVFLINLFII